MKKLLFFSLFTIHYSLSTFCQTISTYAGNGVQGYSGDGGPATLAELNSNFGISADAAGTLFIADNQNHRAREVDLSGTITTFAGNGISGYSGNGGFATDAELGHPADIITDTAGNIFVVDFGFPSVREVHTAGRITTFAGDGSGGFTGDGGPASTAEINNPCGLAMDNKGNIYISDRGNNRIRKVDTAGTITTFAGNGIGGFSGDGGPAGLAELNGSNGICFDPVGNLYIADYLNDRVRIIDTNGIINTIGGNGNSSYSGDGGPATSAGMTNPMGVAADAYGNLYVADYNESRIRLINSGGTISTFAGNGFPAFYGDGGPATLAEIAFPTGVCLDASGNLYISDDGNSRIRKITGISTNTNKLTVVSSQWSVYPNPSNGIFLIAGTPQTPKGAMNVKVYNLFGQLICSQSNIQHPTFNIDLTGQPSGLYFYKVSDENGNRMGEGKIVLQH